MATRKRCECASRLAAQAQGRAEHDARVATLVARMQEIEARRHAAECDVERLERQLRREREQHQENANANANFNPNPNPTLSREREQQHATAEQGAGSRGQHQVGAGSREQEVGSKEQQQAVAEQVAAQPAAAGLAAAVDEVEAMPAATAAMETDDADTTHTHAATHLDATHTHTAMHLDATHTHAAHPAATEASLVKPSSAPRQSMRSCDQERTDRETRLLAAEMGALEQIVAAMAMEREQAAGSREQACRDAAERTAGQAAEKAAADEAQVRVRVRVKTRWQEA